MKVVIFGVTHKNSNITLREKVAFSKSKLQQAYDQIMKDSFLKEAVIISTCNRSEIFAVVEDTTRAESWFKSFYEEFFKLEKDILNGHYLFRWGKEAVRYLYEVCCGLDSLVLGEDQILGQVKEAHYQAMEVGCSGKILNKMFLEGIATAKEVKSKTGMSENPLSISTIAVKQIEKELGELKGKRVLVIGFGKMSRIAMENLLYRGVSKIYVSNRTREPIEQLEKKHHQIQYLSFEDRYKLINGVDIIISATGAPHLVLSYDEFQRNYPQNNTICIVDIALPRDVDPQIGKLEGINLFHIDELKEIAAENMAFRENCLNEAKEYIEESLNKYCDWYQCIPIHSRIEALMNYSERLTDEELSRLFEKLSHMEDRDKKQIEIVVKSLIKKMWKEPILQMKQAGVTGRGEQVASVVDELFGFHQNLGQ